MKAQLLKLMETEGLTPAKFADEIGVQRSSISHILSDRNKPSYDFILKILGRFPGINAEWLITGSGSMIKSAINSQKEVKQTSLFNHINENTSQIIEKKPLKDDENSSIINNPHLNDNNSYIAEKNTGKDSTHEQFTNVNSVEFIMFFYKDGTFKRYTPR